MPLYLKDLDILPQIDGLKSLLIVPCRFCPAASMAIRKKKPYIEFFRRLFRTKAYESFIKNLNFKLKDKGIKTTVFDSKLPHQFVACMWTPQRRKRLAKIAADFEAVVVLGCDATVELVRNAVRSTDCRVIQGMEMEGIMNIIPIVSFPFNIWLDLQDVTPLKKEKSIE